MGWTDLVLSCRSMGTVTDGHSVRGTESLETVTLHDSLEALSDPGSVRRGLDLGAFPGRNSGFSSSRIVVSDRK